MTVFKHVLVLIEDKHQDMVVLKRALRCLGSTLNKLTVYRQSKIHQPVDIEKETQWQQQETSAINAQLSACNYSFELNIVFNSSGFDVKEFGSFLDTCQPDVIFKLNTAQQFFQGMFRDKTERYFVSDCAYPIWIVKPRTWDEQIEVLSCLDVDDNSETNHRLNTLVLAASDQIARILSGQLHVIDCFFGEVCSMSFEVESSGQFKRTTSVMEHHKQLIQTYIADLTLTEQSLHVVSGTPDFAIPDTADSLQAELVVIGNNADHGIMDRLFGDTAVNLVNNIMCDVLVLKP